MNLQWSHCRPHFLAPKPSLFLSLPSTSPSTVAKPTSISVSTINSVADDTTLTAKERRLLRKETRESKPANNWKEDLENDLMKKKPKKVVKRLKDKMNLNNLADLGTQWWILNVTRARYQESIQRMAKSLVRNYPEFKFKVYAPSIQVKRKLKNGTISVKPTPVFPGLVFLNCVLDREMHDVIRECVGIYGFIGVEVGSVSLKVNIPKPVAVIDMEKIFQQAKEAQEKYDKEFEEEQQKEGVTDAHHKGSKEVAATSKTKRQTRKVLKSSQGGLDKSLVLGSSVRIISGLFADFSGTIKKLDRKRGMAAVRFTVFGKEILADLQANEIVAETN